MRLLREGGRVRTCYSDLYKSRKSLCSERLASLLLLCEVLYPDLGGSGEGRALT